MRNLVFLLLIIFFSGACSNTAAPKKQSSELQYFDLKGYISKEAERLKKLNPEIDKTVMVNQAEEHKKVTIGDWQKELSAFSDADMNKSAWEGLFQYNKTEHTEVYVSKDEKVPVKSLTITFSGNRIAEIRILNSTANSLYSSNDTLSYYPDSLYEIRKTQHIRLLNQKDYRITGRFK